MITQLSVWRSYQETRTKWSMIIYHGSFPFRCAWWAPGAPAGLWMSCWGERKLWGHPVVRERTLQTRGQLPGAEWSSDWNSECCSSDRRRFSPSVSPPRWRCCPQSWWTTPRACISQHSRLSAIIYSQLTNVVTKGRVHLISLSKFLD